MEFHINSFDERLALKKISMCPGLGLEASGSLGFMTVGVVLEVRSIYVDLRSIWKNVFLTMVKCSEPLIYALLRSRTVNPKPYH